jgi:hypothetical protein
MLRLFACVLATYAAAALGAMAFAQSSIIGEKIDRDRFQKVFEKLELEVREKSQIRDGAPTGISKDDGVTAQSPGLCQINPNLPQCSATRN